MGPDLELVVKFPKSLLGWVKLTKFSINDALEGLPQGPYHDFPVIFSATSTAEKRAVIMPSIPMLQSLLHEAVKHYQAHVVPMGETPYLACRLHQGRRLQGRAEKAMLLKRRVGASPAMATGLAPSGSAGCPTAQNAEGNIRPNVKHGRMHRWIRQACETGTSAYLIFIFLSIMGLHMTHSHYCVSLTPPHDAPLGREFNARIEFSPWD